MRTSHSTEADEGRRLAPALAALAVAVWLGGASLACSKPDPAPEVQAGDAAQRITTLAVLSPDAATCVRQKLESTPELAVVLNVQTEGLATDDQTTRFLEQTRPCLRSEVIAHGYVETLRAAGGAVDETQRRCITDAIAALPQDDRDQLVLTIIGSPKVESLVRPAEINNRLAGSCSAIPSAPTGSGPPIVPGPTITDPLPGGGQGGATMVTR